MSEQQDAPRQRRIADTPNPRLIAQCADIQPFLAALARGELLTSTRRTARHGAITSWPTPSSSRLVPFRAVGVEQHDPHLAAATGVDATRRVRRRARGAPRAPSGAARIRRTLGISTAMPVATVARSPGSRSHLRMRRDRAPRPPVHPARQTASGDEAGGPPVDHERWPPLGLWRPRSVQSARPRLRQPGTDARPPACP